MPDNFISLRPHCRFAARVRRAVDVISLSFHKEMAKEKELRDFAPKNPRGIAAHASRFGASFHYARRGLKILFSETFACAASKKPRIQKIDTMPSLYCYIFDVYIEAPPKVFERFLRENAAKIWLNL